MAFPTTGIIDNFNRADEGSPPSADWTDIDRGLKVVSNQCEGQSVGANDVSFWNANTFGPDCESYVTLVQVNTGSGANQALYLRMTTLVKGTIDGYLCYHSGSANEFRMLRYDNGAATALGAYVAHTFSNGDKMGTEIIGSTFKAYEYSGGTWTEKVSRTDAIYGDAGYIGLRTGSNATNKGIDDDFGGGTVEEAPPVGMAGAMTTNTGYWGY